MSGWAAKRVVRLRRRVTFGDIGDKGVSHALRVKAEGAWLYREGQEQASWLYVLIVGRRQMETCHSASIAGSGSRLTVAQRSGCHRG